MFVGRIRDSFSKILEKVHLLLKILEKVHLRYSREFLADTSKVHRVYSKEFIRIDCNSSFPAREVSGCQLHMDLMTWADCIRRWTVLGLNVIWALEPKQEFVRPWRRFLEVPPPHGRGRSPVMEAPGDRSYTVGGTAEVGPGITWFIDV